jgi:hypothetical protein
MSDKLPTKPGSSTPATTKPTTPTTRPPGAALAAFAAQVTAHRAAQPARIIVAMDEATWDAALRIQADMFKAVATGGLEVQLVAFGGGLPLVDGGTPVGSIDGTIMVKGGEPVDPNPRKLGAFPFTANSKQLAHNMSKVVCRVGYTQIAGTLRHALKMHRSTPIKAMVIVGDAAEHDGGRQGGEVEQDRTEDVLALAHQLGRAGVPVFMFQEGANPKAKTAFEAIAKATKGAYAPFSDGSADQLRDLLKAVAVFATSGVEGLKTMVGTDKRTALDNKAAVLLTCLTEGRSSTVPPKPPTDAELLAQIDHSIPVKGPRPKSQSMLAAEAVMPILDAIDMIAATEKAAYLKHAVAHMDKALEAVNKAMTTDVGRHRARRRGDGGRRPRAGDQSPKDGEQAVAHALATMLHARLG